jgi:hypothetical protein
MTKAPAQSATLPLEPQLIKTRSGSEEARSNYHASNRRLSDGPAGGPATAAPSRPAEGLTPSMERPERSFDAGNGQEQRIALAQPAANGGRRTLHLSLGQSAHGDGGGSDPQTAGVASEGFVVVGDRAPPRPVSDLAQGFAPVSRPPSVGATERYGANEGGERSPVGSVAQRHSPESGAFIDRSLRERVDTDIAAFLAAFDSALDHDTPESRAGLREATDRLLRAGARTRIELERLEARSPLPPRDRPRDGGPAWPQR